jgi:hypothetical protein
MLYALCFMLYALCFMLYALCFTVLSFYPAGNLAGKFKKLSRIGPDSVVRAPDRTAISMRWRELPASNDREVLLQNRAFPPQKRISLSIPPDRCRRRARRGGLAALRGKAIRPAQRQPPNPPSPAPSRKCCDCHSMCRDGANPALTQPTSYLGIEGFSLNPVGRGG